MPEFHKDWSRLVIQLRAEYWVEDYYQHIESRDFVKAFVWKSTEQLGELHHYVQNFTTYSAKAVAVGNLSDPERG